MLGSFILLVSRDGVINIMDAIRKIRRPGVRLRKRDKQSVGKVIWELKGFSADGGMVVIFNCHLLGKKENVHAYRDRILK